MKLGIEELWGARDANTPLYWTIVGVRLLREVRRAWVPKASLTMKADQD